MPKPLLLCFDGTWNRPPDHRLPKDLQEETNVFRFHKLADLPAEQNFYDNGVGVEGSWWQKLMGGAIGLGLDKNIVDGYTYLVDTLEAATENGELPHLFIVGFSRGAYTARSLVGMIRALGVLPKKNRASVEAAYRLYRNRKPGPMSQDIQAFRAANQCQDVKIRFLGVWDTVGSLGLPSLGLLADLLTRRKYKFHDTELSSIVEYAYHAVAIDEHRPDFKPALWTGAQKPGQLEVDQVWFVGAHADVGGGYRDRGLSDIALDWMVKKAANAGLSFDRAGLDKLQPNPFGGRVDSFLDFAGGYYSILRRNQRHIRPMVGLGMDHDRAHPTVKQRFDTLPAYVPQNLGFKEMTQTG